ncbi:hypothetical protein [Salibacterium aidingense]|uniref:hypothetical protein n=1 Tax=Salibacterium aidingense TaxID=384933 RepID=UPI00042914B9|nr:hypothetical protein [Salibacterium aidingense]
MAKNEEITLKEVKKIIAGWKGKYDITKHDDRITAITVSISHPCKTFQESQSIKQYIKYYYPHQVTAVLDKETETNTAHIKITKQTLQDFIHCKNMIQEGHC